MMLYELRKTFLIIKRFYYILEEYKNIMNYVTKFIYKNYFEKTKLIMK